MRIPNFGKGLALSAIGQLGIPSLIKRSGKPTIAVLLFHRFFADDESHGSGIDRLRRQLNWLRATYMPISLPQFVAGLRCQSLPDRAVLVTSDDALTDILGVADEFKAFEVPLCAFVCAGWTAAASSGIGEDLVARAVSAIQQYGGDDIDIRLPGRCLKLSPHAKAHNIDAVITEGSALRGDLEDVCRRIEQPLTGRHPCCTWADLRHLASVGVDFGAHSVSHVNLASVSNIRRKFEIAESKRLCEALAGRCEAFAYPYGTADTHSRDTKEELYDAGFSAGFLTHSDFITVASDPMTLPRLVMPDEPITLVEFRARVAGAGVVVRRLRIST